MGRDYHQLTRGAIPHRIEVRDCRSNSHITARHNDLGPHLRALKTTQALAKPRLVLFLMLSTESGGDFQVMQLQDLVQLCDFQNFANI